MSDHPNTVKSTVDRTADSRFGLSAVALVVLGVLSAPVHAQDGDNKNTTIDAKGKNKPERISVTGSKIRSVNALAPTSVTSISAEALEMTGHVNVMDALLDLPSVAGGLTNESAGFNYANTGMNTLNLRNLGHERTLILINGRRVVSSDVGELLSDMNAIPTSMVKRIDITTGGGSATYGSGAIAGVVNFVLKDDFEGFEFEVRRNQSPKSDNISDSLRLTYGGNFANDNGNAVINIEHSSSQGLSSAARGVTGERFDTDKNVLNPPQLSSYAPKWRYDIGDYQTGWQDGQAVDWDLAQDGYRHADSRTISTPIDRLIINLNSHLYLADDVRLFSEISYAKTQTSNPSDLYWIGSKTSRGNPISINNPYVPEQLKKVALAKGVDSIDYRGRLNEFGTTGFKSERIVSRYVLGLDGTIGDNWDWEISYNYGEVTNDQVGRDINQLNFKKATDVVVDEQTGEYRCADSAFVEIGCVPTDVFSPFTNEQMKFWSSQTTLDGKLEEQILSGSVSNSSLFSLPAGDVGFAAGIEHRREYSEEFPDSVTASGMSGGLQIDGLQGEYEVDEAFVEFEVPLLSEVEYVKSLVLNASGRMSDYSHSGRNDSWQLGSRWEVNDELTFRAQYSQAFRAPTIADMFNGNTRQPLSLDGIDPCHNITATSAGAGVSDEQASACRLIGAVATAIANDGVFNGEPEDDDVDRYSYFGPSPDLEVETAQTTTVGFIYEPGYLENLTFSMDYYAINIDNIISGVGNRYKNERCLEGLTEFCRAVERDADTGVINTMHNYVFNLAGREIEGYDVEIDYQPTLAGGEYGQLKFKVLYSYVATHQTRAEPESDWVDELDQLPYFKHRANFSTNWDYGNFTANWTMVYQGSIFDDKNANYYNNHVSAHVVHNTQVRYEFGNTNQYSVYLGIDNVFDQDPPFLPEGYRNGTPQTATAAPYSRIGRMWYIGSKYSF